MYIMSMKHFNQILIILEWKVFQNLNNLFLIVSKQRLHRTLLLPIKEI